MKLTFILFFVYILKIKIKSISKNLINKIKKGLEKIEKWKLIMN